MYLKETYNQLIHTRGIHYRLNLSPSQLNALRVNYKRGKTSKDKMEAVLKSAGYTEIIQAEWGIINKQ